MAASVRPSPAAFSSFASEMPTELAGTPVGGAEVSAGGVVAGVEPEGPLSLAAQADGPTRSTRTMRANSQAPGLASAVRLIVLTTTKKALAFDSHLRATPSAAAHPLSVPPRYIDPEGIAHRKDRPAMPMEDHQTATVDREAAQEHAARFMRGDIKIDLTRLIPIEPVRQRHFRIGIGGKLDWLARKPDAPDLENLDRPGCVVDH